MIIKFLEKILQGQLNNIKSGDEFKVQFINVVSGIGIFTFLLFGIININQGNNTTGLVELFMSLVIILNLISLYIIKKIIISSIIVLSIVGCALLYLLFGGGIGNTGIFWYSVFPMLSLILFGKWRGLISSLVLILTAYIISVLGDLQILILAYDSVVIRQLCASLLVLTCIMFFYTYVKEKKDTEIIVKNNELQKAFDLVSSEMKVRAQTESRLAEMIRNQKEQNILLENTKKATLNILEDLEIERQTLSSERDKISTILQSIGDAVFVIDKNYKITIFNPVASALSGYTQKEAIGKLYSDILDFEYDDIHTVNKEFINKCLSEGTVQTMSDSTVLISKDKTKKAVSDSAAPIKDINGNVIGCIVVFRDVTREREIDKAKTEFVSLASHQLRTPLSAINWYCELLEDEDNGKLNEEQKEYLSEIKTGNQRMVELVNSLLNVSRIDLGTFAVDPQPTEIIPICDSVIMELTPMITEKEMHIEKQYADQIPIVNTDPKLMRIIFQNLLSNAVKYTPNKGTITIIIKIDENDLIITVKDTGYGIPQAQHQKIFEKLFRADNVRALDTEGTGLGLYVVKSIVDTAKGHISFDSAEGQGTTFFVHLPLSGMAKKDGSKELS